MNPVLQTGTPTSDPQLHLDADQLSAFMEGALPEPERLAIMRHMAECDGCREIVFLAQAAENLSIAQETAEVSAIPANRSPEPRASLLHWLSQLLGHRQAFAALSFAVVACCIVGVLIFRSSHPSPQGKATAPTVSKLERPRLDAPNPTGPPMPALAPAGPPPPDLRARQSRPILTPQTLPPSPPKIAAPPPVLQSQNAEPPPPATQLPLEARKSALKAPLKATPLPLQNQAASPAPVPQASASQPARTPQTFGYATAGPPAPAAAPKAATANALRAAPAPAPPPAVGTPDLPANMPAGQVTSMSATSETVEVSSAQMAVTTPSDTGRVEKMLPQHALPSRLPSAASAAAGSVLLEFDRAGTLFRSTNKGKNWKRVKPAWEGTIQLLRLTPDSHFEVITTEGETWLSEDGHHWSQAPAASRE